MRLKDVIFVIVTAVLWYFSIFYIAAPHDVHNMLFGGFGMTHEQHHVLGFLLFMISLVIIAFWASTIKDESDAKEPEKAQNPGVQPARSPTPA